MIESECCGGAKATPERVYNEYYMLCHGCGNHYDVVIIEKN